jgi:hypothetical protein
MLVYTDVSKECIINALKIASDWDTYGDTFRNELHKVLSRLHLRPERIVLVGGSSSSKVDTDNRCINFDAEFCIKWIRYGEEEPWMVGAIVWDDRAKEFSTHT